MKISVDDKVAAAVAGGAFSLTAACMAAWLLRGSNRVQAARAALLGRPVAYRLHLHGTGIELAPWEKNLVAECVVRRAPESGLRIGPVVPRPDQQGSVIRDCQFIGGAGAGIRITDESADDPGLPDAEVSSAEDADRKYFLPARCENGHEFTAPRFAMLGGRATLTQRTPVKVTCPECGADAWIAAGRYSASGGKLTREDLPDDDPGA